MPTDDIPGNDTGATRESVTRTLTSLYEFPATIKSAKVSPEIEKVVLLANIISFFYYG